MANNLMKVKNGSEEVTLTDEIVLNKVKDFVKDIELPQSYDYVKAVKSFCLKLPTIENISNASLTSIFQTAYDYVNQGLDVSKNQCFFVVRGNTLTFQVQYQGNEALAKQLNPDILEINSSVIYQGDKVEITKDMGRTIVKHTTQFDNIKDDKIIGAYATAVKRVNGEIVEDSVILTLDQIAKRWSQGKTKQEIHKKFPDRMAQKTVINILCSHIIKASPNKPKNIEFDDYDEDKDTNKETPIQNDDVFDMEEFENNNVPTQEPQFVVETPTQVEIVEETPIVEKPKPQVQERDCTKCVICGKSLNQQNVDYYKAHPEKEVICYSCNLARKGK